MGYGGLVQIQLPRWAHDTIRTVGVDDRPGWHSPGSAQNRGSAPAGVPFARRQNSPLFGLRLQAPGHGSGPLVRTSSSRDSSTTVLTMPILPVDVDASLGRWRVTSGRCRRGACPDAAKRRRRPLWRPLWRLRGTRCYPERLDGVSFTVPAGRRPRRCRDSGEGRDPPPRPDAAAVVAPRSQEAAGERGLSIAVRNRCRLSWCGHSLSASRRWGRRHRVRGGRCGEELRVHRAAGDDVAGGGEHLGEVTGEGAGPDGHRVRVGHGVGDRRPGRSQASGGHAARREPGNTLENEVLRSRRTGCTIPERGDQKAWRRRRGSYDGRGGVRGRAPRTAGCSPKVSQPPSPPHSWTTGPRRLAPPAGVPRYGCWTGG